MTTLTPMESISPTLTPMESILPTLTNVESIPTPLTNVESIPTTLTNVESIQTPLTSMESILMPLTNTVPSPVSAGANPVNAIDTINPDTSETTKYYITIPITLPSVYP